MRSTASLKSYALKVKSATLLSATSGIRDEELYLLTVDDIDLGNRTIYIKIAKDYEDSNFLLKRSSKSLTGIHVCCKSDKPLFSKEVSALPLWKIKHEFEDQAHEEILLPAERQVGDARLCKEDADGDIL